MKRIDYYGAEWCPICKNYRPRYEAYCDKNGIEFVYHDCDNESIPDMYGPVRHIPFVAIYGGEDKSLLYGTAEKIATTLGL